jgi:fatty acid-binding protein DegV
LRRYVPRWSTKKAECPSLVFLYQSDTLPAWGCLSTTSAFMGTLLHICPLMNMNDDGKLVPREKIRCKKHGISEMVQRMETHACDGARYSSKCFSSHSAGYENSRTIADRVEVKFSRLNGTVQIIRVSTAIDSHSEPATVALSFLGDRREG